MNATDLLPTICAAAGVALPPSLAADGENLLPVFLGEERPRTKAQFWDWSGTDRPVTNWPRWAIHDGDWKLLRDDGHRVELFKMTEDGDEEHNVAGTHPEIVTRLMAQLDAWKASLPPEPPRNCLSRKRARLNAESGTSDE